MTRRGSWDSSSGIRERLALLAHEGATLDPLRWSYNPHTDTWVAEDGIGGLRRVPVRSEGTASLERIARVHGIARGDAMELIGHPDRR